MVSFQISFLFKSQVSRYSHSLTYGGSDLKIRTWGTPQNLRVDPALHLPVYSLSPHSKLIPVPLCRPPYPETLSTWDSQWPHQAGTQIGDSYCPFQPPLRYLHSHSQCCKDLNCWGFLQSLFIELIKNKRHTGERRRDGPVLRALAALAEDIQLPASTWRLKTTYKSRPRGLMPSSLCGYQTCTRFTTNIYTNK